MILAAKTLFGHPLLHHPALQQLLPRKGIGSDDALRCLERIGLEGDQAARPIGERPPEVSGSPRSRQYAACSGATVLTRSGSSFIE
jgi:hypothetical protein